MNKGKLTLSEKIDFNRDIAPYPLTMLYAGVGSGKSTFAGFLMTGNKKYKIPVKTVLLITSRKAKVIETLVKERFYLIEKIGNPASIELLRCWGFPSDTDIYEKKLSDGNVIQVNVVCTNAYIENYIKYIYDPNDDTTHIWNRFDIIIWDEVHSLITDSTYQSAPFHVKRLIEETYVRITNTLEDEQPPRCKNIICMTGTPEPFEDMDIFKEAHIIDLRKECHCVQPRNIHLINSIQAQRQIRKQMQEDVRVLYFTNHILQAAEAAEKYSCKREEVAVLYSDQTRQKELLESEDMLSRDDFERMQNTQKALETTSIIPKNTKLVITTSKNKEGINILNDDIRHVYIEAHGMTDIVQMAGRLRIGAEHVYIITDSAGHGSKESPLEDYISRQMFNPDDLKDENLFPEVINRHLQDYCEKHGIRDMVGNPHSNFRPYMRDADSQIASYIDLQMSKYAYVQYDHFTQKFMYNRYRSIGITFSHKEEDIFRKAILDLSLLKKMLQNTFPDSIIHMPRSCEDEAREYIEDHLSQNKKSLFTQEEIDKMIIDLIIIMYGSHDPGKTYQRNRYVFHPLGYECNPPHKNKNRDSYNLYRILPYVKEKESSKTSA